MQQLCMHACMHACSLSLHACMHALHATLHATLNATLPCMQPCMQLQCLMPPTGSPLASACCPSGLWPQLPAPPLPPPCLPPASACCPSSLCACPCSCWMFFCPSKPLLRMSNHWPIPYFIRHSRSSAASSDVQPGARLQFQLQCRQGGVWERGLMCSTGGQSNN